MACITKRRERWVVDFYDNTGRRRLVTLPKGSTKKKAMEKLRELEDQLAKGVYIPERRIPLFKRVAADWLIYKKPNLRQTTWSAYEGHTKKHFGELDNVPINRISISHIEKFISTRQDDGMSLALLQKLLISLGQIMSYAVRHRYIDYNPVREAERPKGKGEEKKDRISVLSISQINALLDAEKDQKYKTLFMLAIMSGAIQGKLLGLKWSDVDWENSQIHIQRTFNNGRWYDVKTKASKRRIDLGPHMMTALKRWRLACPKFEMDLVFPNRIGKPINHNNLVNRHFFPALKKAKIDRIRFHDLRHTKASLMIDQKENLKYIQTQLGHASPTVTLNVYTHLLKPTKQDAAQRYENMLFQNSGDKMVTETKKGFTAKAVTP